MNVDKQTLIKYALIAAAAYLVWRWWQQNQQAQLSSPPAAPQLPASQTGAQQSAQQSAGVQAPSGTQPGAGSGVGSGASQPSQVQMTAPSDEDLMEAAYSASAAGRAGSYKLNLWEWNWYRQQAAIAKTGTFIPEQHQPHLDQWMDPTTRVTAMEYHGVLAQAGISGLSGWSGALGMSGGLSPWRM